jgi:hypothetical protein
MRFNRSLVSGFETSGDRGPSPSPCFGSQGAGVGGFCVLSGIRNTTDFRDRKQIMIAKVAKALERESQFVKPGS